MVAYNFQSQWAGDVESGAKCQTIRANGRRRHARPGEALQLYTGMRTKACRKLRHPDPTCREALPVRITVTSVMGALSLMVDGRHVQDVEAFAWVDGFASADAMAAWFGKTHGFPFFGTLIRWDPPQKAGEE